MSEALGFDVGQESVLALAAFALAVTVAVYYYYYLRTKEEGAPPGTTPTKPS